MKRSLRRILVAGAVLVGAGLLLVAFAPTILSGPIGRAAVVSAIQPSVNGRVAIDRLRLSWFGPQRIEGLHIDHPSGRPAAMLFVAAESSLFALLRQDTPLRVRLAGTVQATLREDGSLDLADLADVPGERRPEPRVEPIGQRRPGGAATKSDRPVRLDLPPLDLHLDGLQVTLALEDGTGRAPFVLDNLVGRAEIVPGRPLAAQFTTTTTQGDRAGAIRLALDAEGLVAADGAVTPRGATLEARLLAEGIPMPRVADPPQIDSITATLRSDDLAAALGLELAADATLAAGGPSTLRAALRVDRPFAESGAPDFAPERISGTLAAASFPTALLAPLVRAAPIDLVADVGPVLDAEAEFGAEEPGGDRAVVAALRAERLEARATGRVAANGGLTEGAAEATLRATPALLEAAAGLEIGGDVVLTLVAEGITLPPADSEDSAAGRLDALALDFRLETGAALSIGRGAEAPALELASLVLDGSTARLADGIGGRLRADLASGEALDAGWSLVPPDAARRLAGEVRIDALDPALPERLVGIAPGTLAAWSGGTGALAIRATRGAEAAEDEIAVDFDFPRLRGTAEAALAADRLVLRGTDLRIDVAAERIAALLVAEPEEGADPVPMLLVHDDVAVAVALEELVLPRGGAGGLAGVSFDVALEAGPVRLTRPSDDVPIRLARTTIALATTDLAGPVAFRLVTEGAGGREGTPGRAELDGRLESVLDASGAVDAAAARWTGGARLDGIATDLVDAILGFDGLLTAAIGPWVDGTMTARGFARTAGRLDARLDVAQGFVEARLRGAARTFRVVEDPPLRAELALTEAFATRLLEPIHPIFGSVRTTEQPIRLRFVGPARVPHDGNPALLDADLELTVGAVAFSTGDDLFSLLALFEQQRATVPGSIEPIRATIRRGVVAYQPFTVRIDDFAVRFEGGVDLVKREVDVRWKIPLEGLATTFGELRDLPPGLEIPLVTRGPIAKPKTEIDPEWDLAGAAIESGLGELLRGILDPKKKDDEEDPPAGGGRKKPKGKADGG